MPVFTFQQRCSNLRECTIEADTKEAALAKYADEDFYEAIEWGDEEVADTELWVVIGPDGEEWLIENGEFSEEVWCQSCQLGYHHQCCCDHKEAK